MPRLRNIQTGAVVSCSDETAARLGSEWVSVDATKQAASKPVAEEADSNVEPVALKTKK